MSLPESSYQLKDLLYVMSRLREPEYGCPWDIKQTVETIIPHTVEEVHELVDALLYESPAEQKDELADVLFQVIFYGQLKEEAGEFSFNDIVHHLVEKLVRRHPHVFDPSDLEKRIPLSDKPDLDGIAKNWVSIKVQEKQQSGNVQPSHPLQCIPKSLPGLKKALKIQKTVAKVGFDWDDYRTVIEKIEEEIAEIQEAKSENFPQSAVEEEVGDLLFACVNLARHLGVDPDMALTKCNQKFTNRFIQMETHLNQQGIQIEQADLEKMESAWQFVKQSARSSV